MARFGIFVPGLLALPEFLSKSQYQNPNNLLDGAFQLGHNTKDHVFSWISQHPEYLSQFQNHMTGSRTGRLHWMDPNFYSIEKNLIERAKTESDAVFLVDLGGGKGRDLHELYRKHPNLPGKLVLQDLKGVIEEARASGLDEKIIPMEHNFFTEQPIKGMRPSTRAF